MAGVTGYVMGVAQSAVENCAGTERRLAIRARRRVKIFGHTWPLLAGVQWCIPVDGRDSSSVVSLEHAVGSAGPLSFFIGTIARLAGHLHGLSDDSLDRAVL
jgi:hypothetical protein